MSTLNSGTLQPRYRNMEQYRCSYESIFPHCDLAEQWFYGLEAERKQRTNSAELYDPLTETRTNTGPFINGARGFILQHYY
jgi:hypothetical protein